MRPSTPLARLYSFDGRLRRHQRTDENLGHWFILSPSLCWWWSSSKRRWRNQNSIMREYGHSGIQIESTTIRPEKHQLRKFLHKNKHLMGTPSHTTSPPLYAILCRPHWMCSSRTDAMPARLIQLNGDWQNMCIYLLRIFHEYMYI